MAKSKAKMARAKTKQAKLQNYSVQYLASDEFHHLKREIFTYGNYFFETNNPSPLIIDAGAHIGLATLYFKYLFPIAQIIAIEPNPITFELLEKNIFENQIEGTQTINAAIFDGSVDKLPFFMDSTSQQWFSTAGFLKGSWTGDQESRQIEVPTITLAEIIHQPIDFMKMDIEGAETKALLASSEALPLIKQFVIEFHPSSSHQPQELVSLLEPHFALKFFQNGKLRANLKKIRGLFNIHGTNIHNKNRH